MEPPVKLKPSRLSTRLTMLSMTAAIGLGLVFSVSQIARDFSRQQNEAQVELHETVAAFTNPATQAAYTLDPTLAREVVEGLLEHRHLSQARILDEENHPLASRGKASKLPNPQWFFGLFENSGDRYDEQFFALVHQSDPGYLVGQLQVEVDRLQVYADFLERSLWTFLAGLLRNVILAGLLLVLFHRFLTRPFERLVAQVGSLDPSRPGRNHLESKPGDGREFRDLRRSLNGLIDNIQSTRSHELYISRQLQAERDLFIGGRVMVFKCRADPGLPIEYASPNIERILSLSPTALSRNQESFEALIHPDDRRAHQTELQKALDRDAANLEHRPYRVLREAGEPLWVYDFTNLIEADDASGTTLHSYLVDITNQVEAQAALLQSQERLKKAQAMARLGSWTWWPEEDRFEGSEELQHLLGLDRDSAPLNLERLLQAVYFEDRARLEAQLELTRQNHSGFELAHRIERPDGQIRQIHHRAEAVLRPSGALQIEGILQDVTEIKQTESFLTKMLATTSEGFWEIDNQARTRMVNPALCRILGRGEAEILGRSIYDFVDTDKALLFREELRRRDRGEEGIYEVTMRRGDGSKVDCLFNATPIYDERDQKAGSFALITDISELKRTHEELLKAKLEAEAANRAKTEFLANMSHEIRTPLNAVIGFADILQTELEQEENKRYVGIIQTASGSLLSLINDLLDLTKIEAGMLEINLEPVHPKDLLKDLGSFFEEKLHQKGLSFSLEADPELPLRLYVDELRLRQVLLNLVGNAIKFTETGHVAVYLGAREQTKEHLELLVEVQDTGIGIPPQDQELIFDSFRQRDGQSTRKYGGTGLGLAVSKRFVELMGGYIEVESEEGQGSLFRVVLPGVRYLADPPEPGRGALAPQVKFKDLHVLVVDDVEMNRNLTTAIFGTAGIHSNEAESGAQAIEMAQSETPDLILMDIRMPKMDGYEAARRIRRLPQGDRFTILALTASVSTLATPVPGERLFDGIIHKPVRPNELLRTLSRFFPGRVEV